MKSKKDSIKVFSLRLSKEMWTFLKNDSTDKDTFITDIITECLDKYKKRIENKLTKKDINI